MRGTLHAWQYGTLHAWHPSCVAPFMRDAAALIIVVVHSFHACAVHFATDPLSGRKSDAVMSLLHSYVSPYVPERPSNQVSDICHSYVTPDPRPLHLVHGQHLVQRPSLAQVLDVLVHKHQRVEGEDPHKDADDALR